MCLNVVVSLVFDNHRAKALKKSELTDITVSSKSTKPQHKDKDKKTDALANIDINNYASKQVLHQTQELCGVKLLSLMLGLLTCASLIGIAISYEL